MTSPMPSPQSLGGTSVTDLFKQLMHACDRHCFWFVLAVFAPMIWLNYHDYSSQILDQRYLWFHDFIRHGFAPPPGANLDEIQTFPMWGYGFVLLLSEHRLVLILLQAVLATAAVWAVVHTLAQQNVMSQVGRGLLVLLVAMSLPWYEQQTTVWHYSFATSLWIIALALLARASVPHASSW